MFNDKMRICIVIADVCRRGAGIRVLTSQTRWVGVSGGGVVTSCGYHTVSAGQVHLWVGLQTLHPGWSCTSAARLRLSTHAGRDTPATGPTPAGADGTDCSSGRGKGGRKGKGGEGRRGRSDKEWMTRLDTVVQCNTLRVLHGT